MGWKGGGDESSVRMCQLHTFMSFSDLLIAIVLNVENMGTFCVATFLRASVKRGKIIEQQLGPSDRLSSLLLIGN